MNLNFFKFFFIITSSVFILSIELHSTDLFNIFGNFLKTDDIQGLTTYTFKSVDKKEKTGERHLIVSYPFSKSFNSANIEAIAVPSDLLTRPLTAKDFKLFYSYDIVNWILIETNKNNVSDSAFDFKQIDAQFFKIIFDGSDTVVLKKFDFFLTENKKENFIFEQGIIETGEDTALIISTINSACLGILYYGIKSGLLDNTIVYPNASKNHRYEISKLQSGSKYYYKIEYSYNNSIIKSKEGSFFTKGEPPPQIEKLDIISHADSVEFKITANTPVKYIFETSGLKIEKNEFSETHFFTAAQLNSDSIYSFTLTIFNKKDKIYINTGIFATKEKNAAAGKKTDGTFTVNSEPAVISQMPPIISRITDGKLDYFRGMASSSSVKKSSQYAVIDLGTSIALKKIKVYWRALAYSKKYMLLISDDNKKWEVVAADINPEMGISQYSTTGDPMLIHEVEAEGKHARYVKLWLARNSDIHVKYKQWEFVQLFEIEVISK